MPDERLPRLVELACHDLRTPLATISGFAKTLARTGELNDRDAHFVEVIDEAAGQLAVLVDLLAQAARIESGRYAPPVAEVDTMELARAFVDERITVEGAGLPVETSRDAVGSALGLLAVAAIRFGEVPAVSWRVRGRELALSPLAPAAEPVVTGATPRDLGALVARMTIEALGGAISVGYGSLAVQL